MSGSTTSNNQQPFNHLGASHTTRQTARGDPQQSINNISNDENQTNSNGGYRNLNHRDLTQQTSGSTRPFKAIPYTYEQQERIQQLLDKVLGPEYVSFRPGGGGQSVSYIEGWKALNLANEIFGFNGWSSELISSQVDYFDTHGNSGRFSMGLSVVVRITIRDGTYHEDFGYGYIDNAKSKAMAFEKCKKEAFTDGLKRCLRCFGNVLGNCLYDKTIISKMQKVKLPPVQLEDENFHRDPMLVKREERKRQVQRVNVPESTPSNVVNKGRSEARDQENMRYKNEDRGSHLKKNAEIVSDFDDSFVFSDDQPVDIDNGRKVAKKNEIDDDELEMIFHEDREFSQEQLNMDDSPGIRRSALDTDVYSSSDATSNIVSNLLTDNLATPHQQKIASEAPLFVSAKKADLIQKGTDVQGSKIPEFDPKFVSPNIRRTIDPTKSVPVKRSEVSTLNKSTNKPDAPSVLRQSNRLNLSSSLKLVNNSNLGKRMVGLPPSQSQPQKRLRRNLNSDNSELLVDKEN